MSVGDSSGGQYYRSVARIGRQTAEALAYAHVRGIIHRDVKPSNLLLDTAGVVWITDFGLAKTQDVALTTTGDIVGTLRYMAPERLQGEGDERADVYALGLTLYELLVLRPAFEARDRLQLVDRIKSEEPPRPRSLDRRIPRDLETIILKAIHKEPKRRYQTAEAMAEDLRRFLANEPIKAKRTSQMERLRLWSRRNPALATLLVVLALVATGATGTAFYLRVMLWRVEKAELEGKHDLWLSYLAQARASRMSRQSGQRFDSLRAIQAALALPVPPGRSRDELRTEAIAALCLPDLELIHEGGSATVGASGFAIDPAFQRYAWGDKDGKIHLHRLIDDKELLQLPGCGLVGDYWGIGFSPDGRFLHLIFKTPQDIRSRLWDLDAPQPKAVLDDDHVSLAFRPDSREVAASYPDRTVRFFDPATGREKRRFSIDVTPPYHSLHWNPQLPQLMIRNRTSLRLLNVDTGESLAVGLKDPPPGSYWDCVSWHPEGRLLAASEDRKIYLWDVPTARLALPPLEGHRIIGMAMCFNHAGDRLLSSDWSHNWHLWDTRSGQLLLTKPGSDYLISFSPDDRLVVGWRRGQVRLYNLRRGEELRTVVHGAKFDQGGFDFGDRTSCLDSQGRLYAICAPDGIALVDVERREEAALLPLPGNRGLCFDSEGALWSHGAQGLLRWPLTSDPKTGQHRFGPPERVFGRTNGDHHGSSRDAHIVAIPQYGGGAIVFHRDSNHVLRLGPQEDVRSCAVSPDGRWVATGSHTLHEGSGAKIWDAKDGKHVKDLPVGEQCAVRFSPDGKWLLTSWANGVRLWVVGTWEEGPHLGGERFNTSGAFTRDGKLLALGDKPGIVRLVVPDSGAEIARLTAPEQTRLAPCHFTPDGTKLITVGVDKHNLFIFDLRAVREGLAELDLDWDAPPYPPAAALGNAPPPLQITVDLGLLVPYEEPRQAAVKYSLALAVMPINPVAYLRRGHAYFQMNQWNQASDDLSLALALDPNNKDTQVWLELAAACRQSLRLNEEAAAYSRIIELGGADASSIYNNRGVAYYGLGLWEKAIADFEKVLKLQPDLPMGKNNLAWNLTTCPQAKFRDPVRAVELAKQAVAAQPMLSTFWTTLGLAQYRSGDCKAARETLQKSLELGQGNGSPYWFGRTTLFLAMSHWKLGDKEKARTTYDQALGWIAKNQPKLQKDQTRWKELCSFQDEAAKLGIKDQNPAAEKPKPQAAATDASEIERLIRQLGSDSFTEREAASRRLEAIGEPAWNAVRKAAQASSDAEIRQRCKRAADAIGERCFIEIRRFEGHKDAVFSVAFSPDGHRALSGAGWEMGNDPMIRVWDVDSGEELRLLRGHSNGIMSVVLSTDGKRAVSGSQDRTIRLWELETGKELKRFEGHENSLFGVALSPNGKLAISCGCEDKTIRLWDIETGREIKRFTGHSETVRSLEFSPTGRQALSGSYDGTVRLWDVATGKAIRCFTGHTDKVHGVAFCTDGRKVVSGALDKTIRLWDVETGKEIRRFHGHTEGVHDVTLSPDGRRALSAGWDRTARLWDLETGEELYCFRGHTNCVLCVAFAPDGHWALSGGMEGAIRLWRLPKPDAALDRPPPQESMKKKN